MPVYYKDDFGFNLCFTVRNKTDGLAFDLDGYTIKFYMWLPSATSSKVDSGVCNPDPAILGGCEYPVQAVDFDTIGSYNWELILTKAGAEIHVRGNLNIVIKEEHP